MQEARSSQTRSRRRIAENLVSLYVLQGLNYIIPIAVLPYLVRVLGIEMYGLTAFVQSFAQYFTILTDYGFNYSATRSIAQQRQDSAAVSRLFSAVLAVKLLLMLVGGLALVGIVSFIPRFHRDAAYFYVGYISVAGSVLFPVWYYQGIEQMRYISVVSGLARLLAAAALFMFVHHPQDALLAIGIQSGGILLSGVAGFTMVLLHFKIRLVSPLVQDMKVVMAEGWHLFVSTAAISLYTNTNVFLVGMLAGNVEAGYFSAAEKVVRAMIGLIAPISQAIFPHVNTLVKESHAMALRFARKTLAWMLTLTLAPSLLLLLLAGPVAHLCFGHNGAGSIPVMRWIALLPVVIALSNVLGIQIMIPFGLDKQFSRILLASGVLNVLMAVPLIRIFGAEGAGASVLVTEVLVTVGMVVSLERHGMSVFRLKGFA